MRRALALVNEPRHVWAIACDGCGCTGWIYPNNQLCLCEVESVNPSASYESNDHLWEEEQAMEAQAHARERAAEQNEDQEWEYEQETFDSEDPTKWREEDGQTASINWESGKVTGVYDHGSIVQVFVTLDAGGLRIVNFDHRQFSHVVFNEGDPRGREVIVHGTEFHDEWIEFL